MSCVHSSMTLKCWKPESRSPTETVLDLLITEVAAGAAPSGRRRGYIRA